MPSRKKGVARRGLDRREGMEPRRAGLSRLRLIKAARLELSKSGYAGASLAVIAAAAGLRKPSIFAHFATKDELYAAVVEDCLGELTTAVEGAALEATTPDVIAAAIERLYREDAAGARVLVRELFDGLAPATRVRERLEQLLAAMCERWPAIDGHLALSLIGMHLFWWATQDPAAGDGAAEHRARLLAMPRAAAVTTGERRFA
jgi:AcrR family transcriptional regulator